MRRMAMTALAATAVGAAALVVPVGVPVAVAAGFEGGVATARAEAVRVQVDSPGAPASDRPVEFAFPASSAVVSGLEGSSAMAALADPGEIVLNGPGLCKVVYPQCPDFPAYPFLVESTYGTANEARATYGPSTLEAVSQELTSTGSARTAGGDPSTAGGQNAAVATGTLDPGTGVSRAVASTVTEGISFGDTLKIASVRSTATVSQKPGKPVVRQGDLAVEGLMIAGQAVGITQNGLVVGSNTTPLPAGNPFEEALAAAGLQLRWVAGYETARGVVAPSLEIVATGQFPSLPAPSVLTMRLGSALAEVEAGRAIPSFGPGSSGSGSSSSAPSVDGTSSGGSSLPAASVPAFPDLVADAGALPQALPQAMPSGVVLPDVTIGGRPLDLAGVTTTTAGNAGAVLGTTPSDSGRSLYLVLAIGAVVALGAHVLVRRGVLGGVR